uniref:DNA helicase Pif1-like 2B domain-containing protein n=1 Tax=Octopus bimaculoides TaxID=37653 RepID=A0A0L8IF80_OCTBM
MVSDHKLLMRHKRRSFLCDHVDVVELTTNLRLLTEGNGNISVEQSLGEFKIKLPNDLCVESATLLDLCDFIYADLKNNFTNAVWLANRAIVTPTNEAAQFVNDFLLTRIPGELKIYRSSDTVDNETLYPIEFINKLTPSRFPSDVLKKNCSIMLLRNLDATNGYCNGTRYIIVMIMLLMLRLLLVLMQDQLC